MPPTMASCCSEPSRPRMRAAAPAANCCGARPPRPTSPTRRWRPNCAPTPEARTHRARRASMAWMGRGLHRYIREVRQAEGHMPRRRRPTPCRRLRSRQAKREGCWRTPPHLTANVRLVSRTCASCHVRDGVVTFLPRDGGRTYMTRHVVSQRTPPRGGCTTEPSSCDTTYQDQVSPFP